MRQFVTIAVNAFMELARQPVFLLLLTGSALFEIFLATPFYFAFGDEPKLVKNSVLAVMLLVGFFGAVLSASSSVAREIRVGTALAVLSKPVGRAQFLLAKFAGVAAALTLLAYVDLLTALLAGRMAFDAYGATDVLALLIFGGAVTVGYLAAAFSNYYLRRPFVSDAVFMVTVMVTLAFGIINLVNRHGETQAFATGVDWSMVPIGVLILFGLWVMAGIALACSTRLDTIPTLAVCSAVFLLGLMSNYFFSEHARAGSWPASVLYTVLPNWQNFWLGDVLDSGKNKFLWGYVGKAFIYMLGYVGAVLALAVMLFEDRELS
jgi:ABC-type transport system involved in multi-copper enzyme maturation permease subunit